MIINDKNKIIFFLTPRCSSTTLHDIIVNNLFGCNTVTSVTSANVIHHHTRLDGKWQNKYIKYTAVVPTRPLLNWAISCYDNFVSNFPKKNFSSSFEEFVVNMHGIDTRYGNETPGFDWFKHSPQNMIALSRGRKPSFMKILTIRHDHLMEDLWQIIEDKFQKNITFPNIITKSCHPTAKVSVSDEIKKSIVDLCCPFGEFWDEEHIAKKTKLH